jgi:hypothetical protein
MTTMTEINPSQKKTVCVPQLKVQGQVLIGAGEDEKTIQVQREGLDRNGIQLEACTREGVYRLLPQYPLKN